MSRSKPHYVLCGLLQLLCSSASPLADGGRRGQRASTWISASPTLLELYLRSVTFGGAAVRRDVPAARSLAKWLLIGRWKPRQFPVWSLAYVRFWLVKTLVRASPLAAVRRHARSTRSTCGRSGAKIGRGVTIFSPTVPVCTDLLTIGAGTVIRKDPSSPATARWTG